MSSASPAQVPSPAPSTPARVDIEPKVEDDEAEGGGAGDGDARPRRQRFRFEGDLYNPLWVRFDGGLKEGLCEQCPKPGRWLQLKNSAY
ncbi:hypothetical protein HK101_005633, partial [Irineochytrium annulatum]